MNNEGTNVFHVKMIIQTVQARCVSVNIVLSGHWTRVQLN